MATNPMQRKARNSFLLGMIVTLLITGLIIAFLFMQLMEKDKKEKAELQASVLAYTLKQDVSSGQVITTDMLEKQTVNKNLVPSNATSDLSVIENYALKDKEGNQVYTKNNALYIKIDEKEYEIKTDEETGEYYITKNNDKSFLELTSAPLIAKVSMKKNTLITTDLLSKGEVQDNIRKQEYNVLVLPMDLETGDYIDVRVMFPSGQDYIVVSKKEVEIPDVGGVDSDDTIWINLTEDEILHMSCAIVDAFQVQGAKIYATKYTDPGIQKAAMPTFPLNASTVKLLESDKNILDKAMKEIEARYGQQNSVDLRNNFINDTINSQGQQAQSNLQSKMQESITNSKNSRKEYLDSLSASTPSADNTESTESTGNTKK